MQKKIIAAAIVGCISSLPTLAMADIDLYQGKFIVYGQANVSFDSEQTGDSSAGVGGTTVNAVRSNSSRLGFKGSEDLDNGMAVVWQLEQAINYDTGGTGLDTLTTRDSFVGLSSASLGKVLAGWLSTPYKASTRDLDGFGDGVADNRSLMGYSLNVGSFDGNAAHAIAYFTPNLSGFSAVVAYSNNTPANVLGTDYKGYGTGAAIMYNMAPLYVTAAYHYVDVAVNTHSSAAKIGIGFTMNGFTIGGVGERISDSNSFFFPGVSADHNAYYLTAKYSFDKSAVKIAYTRANDLSAATNTGASQYSVGYQYSLAKSTDVYVLFTKLNNDANAPFALFNGSFPFSAPLANGSGASPSALSVGMHYAF